MVSECERRITHAGPTWLSLPSLSLSEEWKMLWNIPYLRRNLLLLHHIHILDFFNSFTILDFFFFSEISPFVFSLIFFSFVCHLPNYCLLFGTHIHTKSFLSFLASIFYHHRLICSLSHAILIFGIRQSPFPYSPDSYLPTVSILVFLYFLFVLR